MIIEVGTDLYHRNQAQLQQWARTTTVVEYGCTVAAFMVRSVEPLADGRVRVERYVPGPDGRRQVADDGDTVLTVTETVTVSAPLPELLRVPA